MSNQNPHSSGITIGLDIGGTKTHAVAFDSHDDVVAELLRPTATGGPDIVGQSIVEVVAALAADLGGATIDAIGIGIPGLVDRQKGSVRQAVNLGIGEEPLDLVSLVTDANEVRCSIDNDVNAAALGAFRLLESDRVSDLAYLSIGTGIAAGVILRGALHRGHRGVAGEIGHLPVEIDGPRCECGLQGCLETVASGSAIARQWPGSDGRPPSESLVAAAEAGNQQAVALLERTADHLARAVYLLAITYDVDRIVLGGGVADLDGPLLDIVNRGIARLERQSAFVRSLELPSRLLLKPPGSIGAIGAAALTDLRYQE